MDANLPDPERPRSERVALARLAEAVVAVEPAVEPTAGLPRRWLTVDGEERIEGVVAAEDADGRIAVELHLIAHWPTPPLPRLAEGLREALRRAARPAGLAGRLGEVSVNIHDIDLGGVGAVR